MYTNICPNNIRFYVCYCCTYTYTYLNKIRLHTPYIYIYTCTYMCVCRFLLDSLNSLETKLTEERERRIAVHTQWVELLETTCDYVTADRHASCLSASCLLI
eukprot:GHVQ01039955.1.p1 GENE.GHVQ01039955.1~~GHVQ01039955.1.p1  ORF type:complete len:102 (-),score=8.04 GHVQ01039955.1:1339-1644(-)